MPVYFIQDDALFLIKIGWALNPLKRMRDLQTGSAATLTLLGSLPGDQDLERRIHFRFSQHHVHGEWFRPHPEIIRFIIASVWNTSPRLSDETSGSERDNRNLTADLALCEQATPPPWMMVQAAGFTLGMPVCQLLGEQPVHIGHPFDWTPVDPFADARFITASRVGWPAAIRRALAAEGRVVILESEASHRSN